MGGINGFNFFEPEMIRDNTYKPRVSLTSISLFNEERFSYDTLSGMHELKLNYSENFITFGFTASNYFLPVKNRFAYQLEGFDAGWNYTQNHSASYTNIDPGSYVFKVRAANNDGVWGTEELQFRLHIAPPFWKRFWFVLVSAMTLFALIGLFLYYRISRVRKKERQKAEFNKIVSESRLFAMRAQMNPHFIFNSLNSIQFFITNNDKISTLNYLSKFGKLLRQILDNSVESKITLEKEIEMLSYYIDMEILRFEKLFSYQIELPEDLVPANVEIPGMIIQPFVENAIVHGLLNRSGSGLLKISIAHYNSRNGWMIIPGIST